MNVKRVLVAIFAAATMMLSVGGAASAAPNHNASCVAHHAHNHGGQEVAGLAQEGSVADHAKMDCEHH